MGEAHKPTCSRRGSKGPVRREGAKGKRARDAATPPPRPRSLGDTQTARGARATARARNARQTRSWRQTFAAAQFREQLPGRRPVTWRTLYPQWRWRTQRHECLAARGKPVIEEQSVICLHEVQKQVKVIHHRGTSTYMVRER